MSIYLTLCFLLFCLTSVRLCSCRSTVTSEWIIVAGLCLLGNSPTGATTGDSGPELFQPSTLLYFVPALLMSIFSFLWFLFSVFVLPHSYRLSSKFSADTLNISCFLTILELTEFGLRRAIKQNTIHVTLVIIHFTFSLIINLICHDFLHP